MTALRSFLFAVLGAFALLPSNAEAHPHAWVDTTVSVLFGPNGEITGLRQTWLFDEFYSMFVVEGADMNGDGKPDQAALDAVMNENLRNLAEYKYFTEIKSGETVIATGDAIDAETRMVDARLELIFTLPLQTPSSAEGTAFSYMIFDPTYYVEMLHPDKGDPIALVDAPATCTADLVRANPSQEQVLYAASLGINESGGNTLGRIFAEKVEITCG